MALSDSAAAGETAATDETTSSGEAAGCGPVDAVDTALAETDAAFTRAAGAHDDARGAFTSGHPIQLFTLAGSAVDRLVGLLDRIRNN